MLKYPLYCTNTYWRVGIIYHSYMSRAGAVYLVQYFFFIAYEGWKVPQRSSSQSSYPVEESTTVLQHLQQISTQASKKANG